MEEPAATVPPSSATPPVETTPPPVALVNSEGALREGWRDTLPEDIRADKVFDRVSDFQGVMKSLSSAERAFGKDKIAIPNEASGVEEWNAFHEAGGRPATAKDYNFARPDNIPEEHYHQEYADGVQDILFKFGGSKKLADALFEYNNTFLIAQVAKQAQDAELEMIELRNGLYTEWGSAYEQRKHLGNVAIEKGTNGDQESKERILRKFGNDPDFIRYSSNLGALFAEAGAVDTSNLVPTPADIQEQIDNEMASKAYGTEYMKHGFTKAQHQAQVRKVAQLYQEKTKHVKTG